LTFPFVKRSIIEHITGLADACPLVIRDSHVRETPSWTAILDIAPRGWVKKYSCSVISTPLIISKVIVLFY